jgi:hypothetical protein
MTQAAFLDPDTRLPVLTKQPGETRQYRMDFTSKLRGERPDGVVSVSAAALGLVVGSSPITPSAPSISGRFLLFTLAGGTAEENYRITGKVSTPSGQVLEGDGMLYVREY